MPRSLILLVTLLTLSSCAAPPPLLEPPESTFGPTSLQKTAGGYVLSNKQLTVLLDEKTGAISLVHHGSDSPAGVVPTFEPLADSSPIAGYVEPRDEETWQYFGDSRDGQIGWRIVCCLHVNELAVTYLVQNKTDHLVTGHVRLPALAGVRIESFDEDPSLNGPQADGSVRADERTLKPGERINFATRWTIIP